MKCGGWRTIKITPFIQKHCNSITMKCVKLIDGYILIGIVPYINIFVFVNILEID